MLPPRLLCKSNTGRNPCLFHGKHGYPNTVRLRQFKVRLIVQESPVYHRVEESMLFQNPLSENSVKLLIFPFYLFHFSHF